MKGSGGGIASGGTGTIGSGGSAPGKMGAFSGGGAERGAGQASAFSSRSFANFRPRHRSEVNLGPGSRTHRGEMISNKRTTPVNSESRTGMISLKNGLESSSKFERSVLLSDRAGGPSLLNINQPVSEMAKGVMRPRAFEKPKSNRGAGSHKEGRLAKTPEVNKSTTESGPIKSSPAHETKPSTYINRPRTVGDFAPQTQTRITPEGHIVNSPKTNSRPGLFERAAVAFSKRAEARAKSQIEIKTSTTAKTDSTLKYNSVQAEKQATRINSAVLHAVSIRSQEKAGHKTATRPATKTAILTRIEQRVSSAFKKFTTAEAATQTLSIPLSKGKIDTRVMTPQQLQESLIQKVSAEVMTRTQTETSVLPQTNTQLEASTQTQPASETRPEIKDETDQLVTQALEDQEKQKPDEEDEEKKIKIESKKFVIHKKTGEIRSAITKAALLMAAYDAIFRRNVLPKGEDVAANMSEIVNGKTESPSIDGIEPDGTAKAWVETVAKMGQIYSVGDFELQIDALTKEFPGTELISGESISETASQDEIKKVHDKRDPFEANLDRDKVVTVSLGGQSEKTPQLVAAGQETA